MVLVILCNYGIPSYLVKCISFRKWLKKFCHYLFYTNNTIQAPIFLSTKFLISYCLNKDTKLLKNKNLKCIDQFTLKRTDKQTDMAISTMLLLLIENIKVSICTINIPSPKVEIASYPCQFRQIKFLFFHEFNLFGSCPNLN